MALWSYSENGDFDYNGKKYKAKFNKRTVAELDRTGFNINRVFEGNLAPLIDLFKYSLMAKYPEITEEEVSELLKNRENFGDDDTFWDDIVNDYLAVRSEPNSSNDVKIGRNESCPCGSGKKYKKCGSKGLCDV